MFVIQLKITRHRNKHKNTAYNKENNQSIETSPELTFVIISKILDII